MFRRSSENLVNTAAVTRLVVGFAGAAAVLALTGCGSSHRAQAPATSTSGGGATTFRDKNNIVRIVVSSGAAPTKASVQADVGGLTGAHLQSGPQAMTLPHAKAYKVVYSTESAPNTVTGKRVKLVVDRYYVWKPGRLAVVDLGTPEGVDNVDAYRLMIESFRWS